MISIWHLVWIIPVSACAGVLFLCLIAAVSPEDPLDMDRKDDYHHDEK